MSVPKFLMWLVLILIALTSITTSIMAFTCESTNQFFIVLMINLFGLALMAPVAVILHRPGFRAGALFLFPIFITIWAGFLVMVFRPHYFDDRQSELYSSMLVAIFMGIPTAVAVMNVHRPWGKWFGWTFAAITLLSTPMVLFAIWARDFDSELRSKIGETGGTGFLMLGTGAICLINLGQRDRRYFRWAGVLISIAAMTCASYLIWHDNELFGQHAVLRLWGEELWIVAAILAMVNMLLMTWHRGLVRWLQWTAIALSALTGIILGVAFWYDFADDRTVVENISRCIGAAGALAVGSIVAMLIARTTLRLRKPTTPPGIDRVALTCPLCNTAQTSGFRSACQKCGLLFNIRLIEPRCTNCNHLLLNLTTERCPECGQSVPARPPLPAPLPAL